MSWPVTNCSPIARSAMSMPFRTSGSPQRARRRPSVEESSTSSNLPESLVPTMRLQPAALTNNERPSPMCELQSPEAILSRISASRVAMSGIRSSASARHMSTTPSLEESEYSRTRASMPPLGPLVLRRSTSRRAVAAVRVASSGERRAISIKSGTRSSSGSLVRAVIARRNGVSTLAAGAKQTNRRSASCAGRDGATGVAMDIVDLESSGSARRELATLSP